jgi:hypothetical protein
MRLGATCICGAARPPGDLRPIASFSEIRAGCPALRKVLVPDSIWPEFKDWCDRLDDSVEHRSVLLLAHERGCLGRVTLPIHRYLLAAGTVRARVRKQYLKDLRETWLREQEPLERHRKWKIFYGHLVELVFAAWLEEQSYTITGLEALREGPDIEAVSPSGLRGAFEVKFIGSEAADYEMLLKSLKGEPSGDFVSPYSAINYLTFRIYEAAKQLQRVGTNRTAVLIFDEMAWQRLEQQLKETWIDWRHPQFVGTDGGWETFIISQYKKCPGLPGDLAETIREIDSTWILRQSSEFEFCHEYDLRTREGEP